MNMTYHLHNLLENLKRKKGAVTTFLVKVLKKINLKPLKQTEMKLDLPLATMTESYITDK